MLRRFFKASVELVIQELPQRINGTEELRGKGPLHLLSRRARIG